MTRARVIQRKALAKAFVVADFLHEQKRYVTALATLSVAARCAIKGVETLNEQLVDEAQLSIFEEPAP